MVNCLSSSKNECGNIDYRKWFSIAEDVGYFIVEEYQTSVIKLFKVLLWCTNSKSNIFYLKNFYLKI